MSLQFVFIFFVLALQSVSSDSFEPFKKDQEEEIKNDLEEDGKERCERGASGPRDSWAYYVVSVSI